MRLRRALLWLLPLSLVLTTLRQVLDFLGFLWVPAVVNLLHIIWTITGIFGTVQFRSTFVGLFAGWSLMWVGWNAFLVCYHLSLGNLDGQSGWLGLGLRGSRSFWLHHTPGCTYTYQYDSNRWEEGEGCVVGYEWAEAGVAVVLGILGLLLFVLAVAFIARFRKEWKESESRASPTVTVEFTQPHPLPATFSGLPNGGILDESSKRNPGYVSDSSGYLNTSFEPGTPSPPADANLAVGSRRSSKKKKKPVRRPADDETTSGIVYADFQRPPTADQFSLAATAEVTDTGLRSRNNGGRAHSSTRETREARAARRRDRNARSVSPGTRRRPHHASEGALAHPMPPPAYIPAYRQRESAQAAKPYRHYNGQAGRLAGSQPELMSAATTSEEQHSGLLAYPREPARMSSVADSAALSGSRDSLHSSAQPVSVRQRRQHVSSLVSFDPKSEQTLLRFQPHAAPSSSRDDSEDSPPLEMAPTLGGPLPGYTSQYHKRPSQPPPTSYRYQPSQPSGDRVSYDSGLPGSSGPTSDGSTSSSHPASTEAAPRLQPLRPPPFHHQQYQQQQQSSYYEPPASHQRMGSSGSQLPPPPTPLLAPLREGVLVALDDPNASVDSSFSMPPPPPPPDPQDRLAHPHYQPRPQAGKSGLYMGQSSDQQPSQRLHEANYHSAASHYNPPSLTSSGGYERRPQPPPPPARNSPHLHHQNSLLV